MRINRLPNFSAIGMLVALALSAVSTVMAQSPSPSNARKWSVVVIATIKPDMRSEFEAWQKEMTAAYKKADVPSRAVLQTVMGNLFEYISVVPLNHFADMDGASPVERALGKEEAAAFMRKGAMYVTSVHRLASSAMDDLSIRSQAPENAPFALVTSLHLVAGKSADYEAWMKNEYLPAVKKAEVKNFWVSRTVFGGDPNERVTVRLMKNMAEIDNGPVITKALGEEGARKLMSGATGIVGSVEYRIVQYRPDLSYDMTVQSAQTPSSK
jgi:hypothetical protein